MKQMKRLAISIGVPIHENAPVKVSHVIEGEISESEENQPEIYGPILPHNAKFFDLTVVS
jgi:hypothetical protein